MYSLSLDSLYHVENNLKPPGYIYEETGEPHESYDPRKSIPSINRENYNQQQSDRSTVNDRQQGLLPPSSIQTQTRQVSRLTLRVKDRACTKCFVGLVCAFIAVSTVILTGYSVGVSLTYPQCEDLNVTKDVYSNNTILVAAGITKDCHSTITAYAVPTDSSDYIDQQINLYVSPCSNLKYYGFPNNKQFITLNNWTTSLRLFDNAYWTVGSNMSIDVSATVLAGQSSVLYVCVFDNSKYFKEFIGYNNWKDVAAKNALNCSISSVNLTTSTRVTNFSFKVSQSKYYYIGLRPTNNLATLDIHTQGVECYFNRSDYIFSNCSASLRQPCKFPVPSDSTVEQCVLAYAVPPADVVRGYSSVQITSPKQNDSTFTGASAGSGVFVFCLLILFVFLIVCYLVLPSCKRETPYDLV